MIARFRFFHSFCLATCLFTLATPAFAGFSSYSVSANFNKKATDLVSKLQVASFDSTLGELESVDVSYSNSVNIVGTLTNTSASARTFNLKEDVKFALLMDGTQVLANDLVAQKVYTSLMPNTVAAFGTYALSGNSGTATFSFLDSGFNNFLGPDRVSFNLATLTSTVLAGNGGNSRTSIRTLADTTLTVTYSYLTKDVIVTPEPASLVMTAIGGCMIGGVGFVRNRGKAKARLAT